MRAALVLGAALIAAPVVAAAASLSLIIDDLGHRLHEGERATRLPAPVVCAVLPHTPHGQYLAQRAHAAGKEVILHLPMQPHGDKNPGSGSLAAGMSETEWRERLDRNLASVPHAVGVNNHMGSLLTTEPRAMRWLMGALHERRLFFIDSLTTRASLGAGSARARGLPTLTRDLFLDRDPSPAAIAQQLSELERLAKKRSHALAIGHPYPATLDALEHWLPELGKRGITVIPVTTRLVQTMEPRPWHASWFH
jgi:hypothetical protein